MKNSFTQSSSDKLPSNKSSSGNPSSRKKALAVIGPGLFCLALDFAASWYAVTYNDSRLVAPMDFSEYAFTAKDLPMICSITLTCLYIFFLLFLIVRTAFRNQKQVRQTQTTRKISPKLGFLGFLGFMGFLGFWTYSQNRDIQPFMFFMFFGFFGFFYEGKLSNTFMDERFRENAMKAQLESLKISFAVIIAAFVLLGQGALWGSLEYNLIAAMIVVFLSLALFLFLNEYLLYRYDHDEQSEA